MDVIAPRKTGPDPRDSSLQFSAPQVQATVKLHEQRATRVINESGQRIAAYMTRFWDHYYGPNPAKTGSPGSSPLPEDFRLEVNRLWGLVEMIDSVLYPTAARVALMPDYAGRGDTRKAQATLNDFLVRHQIQEAVHSAIVQTAIVGAAGFKVGYEPGTARPTDRIYLDVVPAWQMVLDEGCTNVRQERYRGVIQWFPKAQIEEKYDLKGLVGSARTQPAAVLSTDEVRADGTMQTTPASSTGPQSADTTSGDGEWVRVLEFYNLVDPIRSRAGRVYLGRQEIWVLDQPEGLSAAPIRCEIMPFATTAGRALAPLRPLIFASHPFYPYRHISMVEPQMPQIREENFWRSIQAMQARRSAARVGWQVEGAIAGQDSMDRAVSGEDGVMFRVDAEWAKTHGGAAAMGFVSPPPVDPAMAGHVARLAQEFTMTTGLSPNLRSEVTEATKYEVQAVNRISELKLKKAGGRLYSALGESMQVVLRATILAMQDTSDSSGGYAPVGATSTRAVADDVAVAPVGVVTAQQVVDDAKTSEPGAAAATSGDEAQARATVAPVVPGATSAPDAVAPTGTVAVRPFPIRIDGQIEMVTPADLDADFEIQFLDGVRTPLREEARRAAQRELVEMFAALWKRAKAGDVLARAQMETIADAYELPASWRPAALEEAERIAARKQQASAKPATPPDDTMEAATTLRVSPLQVLEAAREKLRTGDVRGALQILQPLLAAVPELRAAVQSAMKDPSPAEALDTVLGGAIEGASGSSSPSPTATEPTPPIEA